MGTVNRRFWALATCTCALFAGERSFGIVIVGGAGAPVMVMDDCCKVILNPAPVVPLPAGGAAAAGLRAQILADFPGIGAANVALGAAAPGTATIDVYAAALYGLDIEVRYNDGVAGPSWSFPPPFPGGMAPSYRFSQKITTNMPLGGVGGMYIDPRPNDDPGGLPLPYYETDAEAARFSNGANGFGAYDLWFWDSPRRPCKNRHTTWTADWFVVSENRFTVPGADPLHVITVHDGFRYGFEIWPKKCYRRNLTLTDLILDLPIVVVDWSPAIWTNNLMTPTLVGDTYPFGVMTPPSPPPSQVDIPDAWPPSNIAPDQIEFNANFIHPINKMPASTSYKLKNLHDTQNLGESWTIDVPLLASANQGNNLMVTVDLSKKLITVQRQQPTTNRQNALQNVLAAEMLMSFNPGAHNLIELGRRSFSLGVEAIEHPRGDTNGDGLVNGLDIPKFVELILSDSPDLDLLPFGDFDMSDSVTIDDIPGFVEAELGL